ncbi:MAG: hypothetical protein PUD59_04825 [bacterium]|nr:hypothetical protein [bacterium]
MKNNRAQVLVIFIIFLPIMILFITYIFDSIRIVYEKDKLNDIVEISKEYDTNKICDLILKNDIEISCNINSNKLNVKKRIKSLFGKIIGRDYYDINININI